MAWLQHLWGLSGHVRGCIFADDLGLGKTAQKLALIHWTIERDPDEPPALVVAPVSLLDNWRNEIARFFQDGASRVLLLYGAELAVAANVGFNDAARKQAGCGEQGETPRWRPFFQAVGEGLLCFGCRVDLLNYGAGGLTAEKDQTSWVVRNRGYPPCPRNPLWCMLLFAIPIAGTGRGGCSRAFCTTGASCHQKASGLLNDQGLLFAKSHPLSQWRIEDEQ